MSEALQSIPVLPEEITATITLCRSDFIERYKNHSPDRPLSKNLKNETPENLLTYMLLGGLRHFEPEEITDVALVDQLNDCHGRVEAHADLLGMIPTSLAGTAKDDTYTMLSIMLTEEMKKASKLLNDWYAFHHAATE